MRIVSWNVQGRVLDPVTLRNALNALGADAVVFQEPYAGLALEAPTTGRPSRHQAQPVGPDWTLTHVAAANRGGHDRYAFACRAGVTAAVETYDDPRGDDAEADRQYIVVEFTLNGASTRVATCHAPYLSRESDAPVLYMNSLLAELAPSTDGGGTANARRRSTQLFMGDTNVYDGTEVNRPPWTCALQSNTGGNGGGGPLDRVYVRGDQAQAYTCGRIHTPDQRPSALSSADRRSSSVADIVAPGPWDESDHQAIYIDTDGVAPVTATATTGAQGGGGGKRGRDLFELDSRGRPRPVEAEKSRKTGDGDDDG